MRAYFMLGLGTMITLIMTSLCYEAFGTTCYSYTKSCWADATNPCPSTCFA